MPSPLRPQTSCRDDGPRQLQKHPERLPGFPLYPIHWLGGGSQEPSMSGNSKRWELPCHGNSEKTQKRFFTVPTALGKLSAYRFEFPTVCTASAAGFNSLKSLNKAAVQLLLLLEAAGKLSAAASSFPQLQQRHPKNAPVILGFVQTLEYNF
jgi:hypothetical protein